MESNRFIAIGVTTWLAFFGLLGSALADSSTTGEIEAVDENEAHDRQMRKLMEVERQTRLEIAQFENAATCIKLASNAMSYFVVMTEKWLGSRASDSPQPLVLQSKRDGNELPVDFNIPANFVLLKEMHKATLTKLQTRYTDQEGPQSLSDLRLKLTALNKADYDLLDEFSRSARYDTLFLQALQVVEGTASENQARLEAFIAFLSVHQCNLIKVDEPLISAVSELKDWLIEIQAMRDYVAKSRAERLNLPSIRAEAVRISLEQRYAVGAHQTLQALQATLQSTLIVARVSEDFERWWIRATMNGLADGLATKYLQYEEPLRILRSHLQRISEYEQKFASIENVSHEVKAYLAERIESCRLALVDYMKPLEEGGWRYVFERQKILTEQRLKIIDKYVPACQASIEEYLKAAKMVQGLEDFRTAEAKYKQQVDVCKGRAS